MFSRGDFVFSSWKICFAVEHLWFFSVYFLVQVRVSPMEIVLCFHHEHLWEFYVFSWWRFCFFLLENLLSYGTVVKMLCFLKEHLFFPHGNLVLLSLEKASNYSHILSLLIHIPTLVKILQNFPVVGNFGCKLKSDLMET